MASSPGLSSFPEIIGGWVLFQVKFRLNAPWRILQWFPFPIGDKFSQKKCKNRGLNLIPDFAFFGEISVTCSFRFRGDILNSFFILTVKGVQ